MSLQPSEGETALADTLAWLSWATRSARAPVDLEAAGRRLEVRLAVEAARDVRRAKAHPRDRAWAPRRSLLLRLWPGLVALVAICGIGLFLVLRNHTHPPAPAAPRVQEVRFDAALWDLESITAIPLGHEAVEMTGLLRR